MAPAMESVAATAGRVPRGPGAGESVVDGARTAARGDGNDARPTTRMSGGDSVRTDGIAGVEFAAEERVPGRRVSARFGDARSEQRERVEQFR